MILLISKRMLKEHLPLRRGIVMPPFRVSISSLLKPFPFRAMTIFLKLGSTEVIQSSLPRGPSEVQQSKQERHECFRKISSIYRITSLKLATRIVSKIILISESLIDNPTFKQCKNKISIYFVK